MGFKIASMDEAYKGEKDMAGGANFFTPAAGKGPKDWGTTRVRILPPRDDHPLGHYYFPVAVHSIEGAGRPVWCPAKNANQFCPACALAAETQRTQGRLAASGMWASWRALVNVVRLNDDGSVPDDVEVQVWAMPKTKIFDVLQAKLRELKAKGQPDDPTHPLEGRDIWVRRKGAGKESTEYEIAPDRDVSELDDKIIDLLDSSMYDLPFVYSQESAENITGYLTGEPAAGATPRIAAAKVASPWDDTAPAIEGEVREIPAVVSAAAPSTPFDADEDDEDGEDPQPSGAVIGSAKDRLKASLGVV
jgi:hypothetical protein